MYSVSIGFTTVLRTEDKDKADQQYKDCMQATKYSNSFRGLEVCLLENGKQLKRYKS